MSKDYLKKNIDLSDFIPQYQRNKLNVSLMKNLFNGFLTKDESLPLYGWVGKSIQTDIEDKPYVTQPSVDRSVNALLPLIYGKLGSEEHVFSFSDLLNKAKAIGIDVNNFDDWGASRSYNIAPPIDIDKFANFNQYYWVANIVTPLPKLAWNPDLDPEYYVIQRNSMSDFTGNDWQKSNYWVHKADLGNFGVSESQVKQAVRPIIEYFKDIELDSGSLLSGKFSFNQVPLFKLYEYTFSPSGVANPVSSGLTSSIFFYTEGQQYDLDKTLKRRVARDVNKGFVFGIGLVKDKKLYYYKRGTGVNATYKSVWAPGPNAPILSKSGNIEPELGAGGNGYLDPATPPTLVDAPNETWRITALSANSFSVVGSKSGNQPAASVGVPYLGIISFTIRNATTDPVNFVSGDTFLFRVLNKEIPRYVYYNEDGKIVNYPGGADMDFTNPPTGTWVAPSPLHQNPYNETQALIKHGDLIDHFRSIIGSQINFSGSVSSLNNFRDLPLHNLGLGGKIKTFDNYFNLFVSTMAQRDLSPLTIIDFAENQYLQALNSLNDFVHQHLLSYLTSSGRINVSNVNNNEEGSDISELFDYYMNVYEDRADLKPVYYDTTNTLKNWGPTLPQLGLTVGVSPTVTFDLDLGLNVFIHHDGHKSPLNPSNPTFDRQLAKAEVERYDGSMVPGFIKTSLPTLSPTSTYKNQLWFNPNNNELRIFNITNDTPSAPLNPVNGDLWYNRSQNVLKQWNTNVIPYAWVVHTNLASAWPIVNTSLILNSLILYTEEQLYAGIPTKFQNGANQKWNFHTISEFELAKFSLKYGYDTYASDYKADDPFTWNYTTSTTAGPHPNEARWHELYKNYFATTFNNVALGTQRPNIEPWKLSGHSSQPPTWDNLYKNTYVTQAVAAERRSDVRVAYVKTLSLFLSNVPPITNFITAPTQIDGVNLVIGNRVLVSDSLPGRSKYNGIYRVNAVYSTHVSLQRTTDSVVVGTNVTVTEGQRWANTKWVITASDVPDINPITWEQYNRPWKLKMWDDIRSYNIQQGRPAIKMCVNVYNDSLLPPYVSPTSIVAGQAFTTQIPQFPTKTYLYGENGPIESVWKKSLEYRYGELRTEFKLDPIKFLTDTWGFNYSHAYNMELDRGYKFSHFDFNFHGDIIPETYPTEYYKFYGVNQYYTQLLRYNSIATKNTYDAIFYNKWEVKLGYRVNSLIKTNDLIIKTSTTTIPPTSYNVILKKNPFILDTWMDSLRIQLIKVGSAERTRAGSLTPINKGEDWEFRIETYNNKRPILEYYELNDEGSFTTFHALDKSACKEDWQIFVDKKTTIASPVPINVTGVQKVLNILYGYLAKLKDDGWDLSGPEDPHFDLTTGRILDWQLEIEKFVHFTYAGVEAGYGHILNPFITNVWIKTPRGMVSDFNLTKFFDPYLVPAIYDAVGNVIPNSSLTIIRRDEFTSISSDTPMAFIHSYIDEYEHVILFDEYIDGRRKTGLLYNPFLGSSISRVFLVGKKQVHENGRPNFGGYFLNGDSTVKNIESHVEEISKYYSTQSIVDDDHYEHALALLGYTKKSYFDLLDISENSQFQFWRGLIQYKGTNSSFNAFLNSTKFQEAEIDEYWLYKLAEYGDARQRIYPEMKVSQYDCLLAYSKFRFESEFPKDNIGNPTIPLDFTYIESLDEERWFSIDDLNNYNYFLSEKVQQLTFDTAEIPEFVALPFVAEEVYEHGLVTEAPWISKGSIEVYPVRIGEITSLPEIWVFRRDNVNSNRFLAYKNNVLLFGFNVNTLVTHTSYPYLTLKINTWMGFQPGDFFTVVFQAEKVNSYTLKFHHSMNPHTISAYNPIRPKFDPVKLIDYQHNVFLEDIPVWHPAIGYHNTEGLDDVDIISPVDPAKYSNVVQVTGNTSYDPLRPWSKNEVGKVWWDESTLAYIPYFDSKIFTKFDERFSRWGSLADYALVSVYEWIESTVPPSEYDALALIEEGDTDIDANIRASGKAARKALYKRTRLNSGRAIAWGYRTDPASSLFTGFSYDEKVYISSLDLGPSILILDVGKFEDFGIVPGMKFAGWSPDAQQPVGEAVLGNEIDYIVGSYDDYTRPVFGPAWGMMFETSKFAVEVTSKTPQVGSILFSRQVIRNEYYVRAYSTGTGVFDNIRVRDIDWTSLTFSDRTYVDFPNVGIKMKLVVRSIVGPEVSNLEEAWIAEEIGNPSHDVYIRQAIVMDVQIPLTDTEMSNDQDDPTRLNWITWKDPTQSDLSSDILSPNNSWVPFYGQYQPIAASSNSIALIKDFINSKLTMKDGTLVEKYKFEWTDWETISDEVYDYVAFNSGNVKITLNELVDQSKLQTFVNGLSKVSIYTIDKTVVTIAPQKIGDRVKVIYKKEIPSDELLKFDPEVQDDPEIQVQFKHDYSYTTVAIRDDSGNIQLNKYYYWVENKSTVIRGKKTSIQQITSNIKTGPDLFMQFQYHLYNQLLADGRVLPPRYNAAVVYGLNRYVTRDNAYKLRFVQNHTLQDDPYGLNLKNVHTEWTLLRKSQSTRIPEQLWNKLTDAACGEDIAGNLMPCVRRTEFDARNGTHVRFGFSSDQILVDSEFAKSTLTFTILNTTLTQKFDGVIVPDYIQALDFSKSDEWFSTPEKSRETMDLIWDTASHKQVNELFFSVLEDALANNYEFTDIIKTSLISAYSVRFIQPPTKSIYDDI